MCSSQDIEYFNKYLTPREITQICDQFHTNWSRNNQVMWSGIPRATAQAWADQHQMQTLTTAMGPLMIHGDPKCLHTSKSHPKRKWSIYMQGASALFAYHIALDEGTVTVLTPPPPERFNPFGETNYQAIEEPILKGKLGACRVSQIELVHPTVTSAQEFHYQFWPVDEADHWDSQFKNLAPQSRSWRRPTKKRWKL
ncbi:hypothetical protein EIK77_000840 [Talaromyces pinophilus]|nr:hypothetical protein EIK77_000840 [Talaromyces pinophilus]